MGAYQGFSRGTKPTPESSFFVKDQDPLEQLLCDELIDLSEDLRRPMSATVTTQYKDP